IQKHQIQQLQQPWLLPKGLLLRLADGRRGSGEAAGALRTIPLLLQVCVLLALVLLILRLLRERSCQWTPWAQQQQRLPHLNCVLSGSSRGGKNEQQQQQRFGRRLCVRMTPSACTIDY